MCVCFAGGGYVCDHLLASRRVCVFVCVRDEGRCDRLIYRPLVCLMEPMKQ